MKKISILFLVAFFWSCDPCRDVTCVNGTCVEGTCECDDGWTGESCEIDMCASVPCEHGTCVSGLCECDAGWAGPACNQCLTYCNNHGECNDAGECECDDGWTGENCDVEDTLCSNTCQWAYDDECDDGGPNSEYDLCACGTDCADCGTRTVTECNSSDEADAAFAVWTSIEDFPCNTQRIDVYIGETEDGLEFAGYLDSYCASQPECGDGCTVTMPVIHGTYYIKAVCNDGDVEWTVSDWTVDEGYCFLLELTAKKAFMGSSNIFRKK